MSQPPDSNATQPEINGKTQGKIRRGQKTPYRKATNEEIQKRIEFLAEKMTTDATLTKTQIHALMRRKYGLHWVTVDEIYIIRAKQLLRDRVAMSRDEARNFGVGLLLNEIKHGKQRLAAEKRLAEIFGYNAPTQHRVGDPQGKPLAPAVIAPQVQILLVNKDRIEATQVTSNPATNGDRLPTTNGNGHAVTNGHE